MFTKFKTEKAKKYVIFFFLFIFFIFFTYLLIPSLFKYYKFKSEIEKKIFNEFSLDVIVNDDIKYVFFPSPRLILKNNKIIKLSSQENFLSEKNNITIKLDIRHLLNFKNLNFNSLIISDSLFKINFSEIKKLDNYFSKILSKKYIKIKRSKFYINDQDKLMFVLNINKMRINGDNNFNRLNFSTKIFGTHFNGYYNKSLKIDGKSNLQISLPKLGFNSKTFITKEYYENKNKFFANTIIQYPKTRAKILYEFYDNKLKILNFNIDSKLIKGIAKGDIDFNPFYFDLNFDISQLYFVKLISNKIINKIKMKNIFPLNNKINGTINIDVKKFDSKSYMIDSGLFSVELKNGILDLKKLDLSVNKTGSLETSGYIFHKNKKSTFIFDSSLYVPEPKKFGSQLMLPARKKLKRVSVFANGRYDIENQEINFNNLLVNGKEIEKKKYNIYSQKINNFLLNNEIKDRFNLFKLRFLVKKLFE